VQLSARETHPELKLGAVRAALALTTYDATEALGEFAARLPAELAPFASALYRPGHWSRGRVVYPQLGGLAADRASVMVVVEQLTRNGAIAAAEVRTLNIEMLRVDRQWRFERLISAGGVPVVPTAPLSEVALAVLADPRIELPDSARWDIAAGAVSEDLLRLLARLAKRTSFGVATLSAGHSWEIYGTPRQSDHSRGLAVDIYRFGKRLVIDDRAPNSATHQLVAWLYDQPEVARMGSPWALDGVGGRSFTDALHQDHLHIAVWPELAPQE
jgi:hypothetical protein